MSGWASHLVLGSTGLALTLQVSGGAPSGAVSGSGTLQLLRITNAADQSWLGVEATDLNFELDFAPITLAVTNGSLLLNQAPVGQAKLDWSADQTANGVPFALSTQTAPTWQQLSLHVEGSASIEFAGLLTVAGTFVLDQFEITADSYGGVIAAGSTGLALQLTLQFSDPTRQFVYCLLLATQS